jgi:hypothetical protein
MNNLCCAFIIGNQRSEAGGHVGGTVTNIRVNQADIPQQRSRTKRVARKAGEDTRSWKLVQLPYTVKVLVSKPGLRGRHYKSTGRRALGERRRRRVSKLSIQNIIWIYDHFEITPFKVISFKL